MYLSHTQGQWWVVVFVEDRVEPRAIQFLSLLTLQPLQSLLFCSNLRNKSYHQDFLLWFRESVNDIVVQNKLIFSPVPSISWFPNLPRTCMVMFPFVLVIAKCCRSHRIGPGSRQNKTATQKQIVDELRLVLGNVCISFYLRRKVYTRFHFVDVCKKHFIHRRKGKLFAILRT